MVADLRVDVPSERRYSRSSSWKRGTWATGIVVEVALDAGEDRGDLLLERPRRVLRLVQRRHHPLAAGERLARGLVELGAELRERLELAVLGEVERRRPATFLIAFVCALPPTRDTEMPTLMAGRTPEKKRSDSRKI